MLLTDWLIKKYGIISFDIFDTLILRNVERPKDLFYLVEKQVPDKRVVGFHDKRISAEKIARRKLGTKEININDIYNYLDIDDIVLKEKLKSKEIELELSSCSANPKIKEFFERAICNGNEVIIISDMYLPKEVIEAMLKRCGISGYKKLYVSNSYNANKMTGKLFEIAISELGISKKNIVHIGDSIKADFLGANKAGIKAVLVHRKNRFRRFI
ncbi:HAD hydrolase-like protein [Oribacterium sp. Sow4_G1_1]|uniref:HAD hydrolase-like protein n=1 Tax=Oribacterium sp. Sow4_G1_1 TaxID=3438794 RepID=UPI003F978484